MPSQPEDRINALCARVTAATDDNELKTALAELSTELREHIQRVRDLAIPQVPLLFRDKDVA
jgi:hypothetical protein